MCQDAPGGRSCDGSAVRWLVACLVLTGCSDSPMGPSQSATAGGSADGGVAGSAGSAARAGAGGRDIVRAGAGGNGMAGRHAGGAGGTTTTVPPVAMEPPDLDPMAGNDGFVQPSCGAPVASVAGPLCGPSSAPCRQIAEHTFDVLGSEPDVSLAFADGEVHILQQRATPQLFVPATDTFRATSEQIQGPTMKGVGAPLGSLAFDGAGAKVALLYGGRPGTTELWRRGASGWAFDSRTQADSVARHRFHASASCLHAGLMLNNSGNPGQVSHPVYAVHDGRWQEFVLGPANRDYPTFPALALDAAGTAHLAYWKDITRPGLYYAVPGRVLERVGATGTETARGVQHLPESPLLAVMDDGGETVVHIAHSSIDSLRGEFAITLATRRAGVWTERVVTRLPQQQGSVPPCPTVEGQSCTFTVESVQQRALFASTSGDLRLFLERKEHTQTATYFCSTMTPLDCFNPPGCPPVRMCGFNSTPPAEQKAEILIGWPEGDTFDFVPYDGPVPETVSPEGHFWAARRPTPGEHLLLVEHGP